jgi:hypothetical protein
MENIVLERYPNPTKPRGWDWMAYFGGEADGGEYGFGATELEAVNDLMSQMENA